MQGKGSWKKALIDSSKNLMEIQINQLFTWFLLGMKVTEFKKIAKMVIILSCCHIAAWKYKTLNLMTMENGPVV